MARFGIPPSKLALSPAEIMADRRERRRMKETKKAREERGFAQAVRDRPTHKVGMARDEYKQAQKEKKTAAATLAEKKFDIKRERQDKEEERKYQEEQERVKHQRKLETEFLKSKLKKPTTADYKIQDAVNTIQSGGLKLENEYGEKLTPEEAVRQQFKIPPTHPAIDKAIREKYVEPQQKYDKAFLEAKNIQRGREGQTYRLGTFKDAGKPEPKTSGIFRTHPVSGELYEYDPKDDSFHKVKR